MTCSCPGLPPCQSTWWEISCGWYCTALNTGWNSRHLLTARPVETLPTKIRTTASSNAAWYFYTSLTLQNYNLSFEGDSQWLQPFISPRALPALQSLISCFICPAHSDKVNYSSAFSSFTLSYRQSITHWVDELVKQHAWGINRHRTNGSPGITPVPLIPSLCGFKRIQRHPWHSSANIYPNISHSRWLHCSLMGARDVSLSEKQLKMTNKT